MLKEFKEFVIRGNVVDMAVGIIIGASFGTIVSSLVADVIMPPIGLILGGVDFSNLFITIKQGTAAGPFATLAEAQKAGAVTINYGMFVNKIVSFVIVAAAMFMVVKAMNNLKKKEAVPPPAATTKDCSFCFTSIPLKATRCPHCTSELGAVK
ncbi:MAG: large-conductance mechanosensitive channel protein MscL [Nitrospirota bacterium]